MGVEGLYTESLQLLIHCVDPERYDDMSFLTQVLIEDCRAKTRKIQETRMLLSLYFWLCYTKKDADNSKLVFDEVYKLVDSFHTKNRYFSTLLETERYQDIIEGEWFYHRYSSKNMKIRPKMSQHIFSVISVWLYS